MQTMRRELLYLVLIGLCSLTAVRAAAQVEGADGHAGSALKQPKPDGVGRTQSFGDHAGHPITIALQQATMKEALRAIASQADVRLIYNDGDLPADRLVTVTISGATVEQALALVLRGTELRARRTEGGIAIEQRGHPEGSEGRTLQGSLSGRVTNAATGLPISEVTLRLEETSQTTSSGSEGMYRFPEVPAGTYTLTARRVGYKGATRTVVLVDHQLVTADLMMTPSPTVLDQVVTTGTVIPTEVKAVPTPVSVITAEQIERQHALTLMSILRQAVPTAVAFSNPANPTATQISLRGASSLDGPGDTKIFVDGVEATNYSFAPVDPESIDRIEVVRGPQAATLYGADAAGGVIQIFTKRGDSASHPRVDAKAAFGVLQTPYEGFKSVPRQEYSTSLHGGGEDVSYHFGGGYSRLADYLPNDEISRQSASSLYGGVHVARSILTADLSARYYDHDAPQVGNPRFASTGYTAQMPPRYRKTNTLDETVSARLTAAPTSWWHNQATVGIARHTTHIAQARPRYTTPADSLLYVSNTASRKVSVGYNASVTGALGPDLSSSLTVGIDHYTQDVDLLSSSRALNVEGSIQTSPPGSLSGTITHQTNTGYFAQAQLGLRDAIFLTAGVRAEDNSDFGSEYGLAVLPRYGLTLVRDIDATTVKVRASYGRALRTPSVGEAIGSVTATSIRLANPLLAAEKQEGWDGGIDLVFGNRGSFSLTGFSQTARDLIAFLQVAATPLPTYQYQNIGRVENRGLELEATFTPAPWLALRAQYGDVHSRVKAVGAAGGDVAVGDPPMDVPSRTGGAMLTVAPREGTTLDAGLTYVGSLRAMDWIAAFRCLASFSAPACPESFLSDFSFREFTVKYPGFVKFNVSVTQRINPQLEVFLAVDNLANKQAFEFDNSQPVIGRTTMLGFKIEY
jgi:outer membrane receptor protein involved in Fe transport